MLCGWIQRFGAVRASKQVLKKEYHPPTDVAIRWIINLGFVYRCSTPRSPRSISCLGPGLYLRGMNPAFGGPPSLINVYYIYIIHTRGLSLEIHRDPLHEMWLSDYPVLVNAGRLYMPEYGMHVFLYCLVCNALIPKENVTPSSFASDSLEV